MNRLRWRSAQGPSILLAVILGRIVSGPTKFQAKSTDVQRRGQKVYLQSLLNCVCYERRICTQRESHLVLGMNDPVGNHFEQACAYRGILRFVLIVYKREITQHFGYI